MVPVMSLMAPVRLHIPAGEAGDVFSHTLHDMARVHNHVVSREHDS